MAESRPTLQALEDFADALRLDDPEVLYEQAPCGYLSTTPDGLVVKVNQTLLTWLGYGRDDLVGRKRLVDLLTPGGRIFHETHYAPMLRMQGTARELAVELVRADGSRFPVLLNANTDRDSGGNPRAVRIALFDAAERRSYERELLRAKEQAEVAERRARELVDSLQSTLIPPSPPQIPDLEVVTAYHPAGAGLEVGGDFFDVFPVRQDDWIVMLGDVCGKGVEAAAVTALVRHTVRALAVLVDSPAEVVAGLHEVLRNHPSDRFCTLVLMRLHRRAGGWTATVVVGGHLPPYLLPRDGAVEELGGRSPLVGVLDQPVFRESHVELEPGDVVVLYTDGLTEARRDDEQYGQDRLLDLVARSPRGAEAVVPAMLAGVQEFRAGEPTDDIAIVAIEVPMLADGPSVS